MKQKLILATLLAVSLAACTNDNDPTVPADGKVAARIVADIDNVATRASGTVWAPDDRIGISTVPGPKTQYTNIPYKWDGKNFNADGRTIYFQSPETVTFNAYYPFRAGAGILAATTDAEAQKNLPAIDFLYAEGATADKANPTVNFTGAAAFRHRMSQISLELEQGDDIRLDGGRLQSYTLTGMKLQGGFNTETGVAVADGEAAAADLKIILGNLDVVNEHALPDPVIVFPQETGGTIGLEVMVEDVTYKATLRIPGGKTALEAGNRYIFPVKVKKTGLTVGTAEIRNWDSVTADDTEAVM